MRKETKYGDLVFMDNQITVTTTYYFDTLKEMLDFRETVTNEHYVHLDRLTIEIEGYMPFERNMVEGDEEE